MSEYKAVIFDFGGVLLDWNPYYLFRKLMSNDTEIEHFLQEIDFNNWNYEFDKGYPFAQGVADLCQKFPARAELIHQFDARWEETIGSPFHGTIDVLKQLKENGVPLYGLSNWSVEKFSLVRPKHEFFNWFKDIVISGEEKIAKPDPRIFEILITRNHLVPGECIYIDDSNANIQVGNKVGLKTIHFKSSQQLREELVKHGILLWNHS
jgi:2-haloacid dehalogenase